MSFEPDHRDSGPVLYETGDMIVYERPVGTVEVTPLIKNHCDSHRKGETAGSGSPATAFCSREKGHDGNHYAQDQLGRVVAEWENKDQNEQFRGVTVK